MHHDFVPALYLHENVECWRSAPLAHRLLRAAPPRLNVAQRNRLNAAHKVGQRGVHDEIVQRVAVRRRHQLHAALRNRARCVCVRLRANLVDDDDLRHVVLHRLDHHRMLQRRRAHLHSARPADARMRNIAVARNLVGSVHDDDAFQRIVRQHARNLAQHGSLAHARLAQQQHALAAQHQILDNANSAVHSPAHAQGQSHDPAGAVAYRRNPVQRPLYAGAVVLAESADILDYEVNVRLRNLACGDDEAFAEKARLRLSAQIQHHFQQFVHIVPPGQQFADMYGNGVNQRFKVCVQLCF